MRKVFIILSMACLIFGIDIYVNQEIIWERSIQYITTLSLESRGVVFVQDSVGFQIIAHDIHTEFQTLPFTQVKTVAKSDSVYLFWSSPFDTLSMTLNWRKIYPVNGQDTVLYSLEDLEVLQEYPTNHRISNFQKDYLNRTFVGLISLEYDPSYDSRFESVFYKTRQFHPSVYTSILG